MKRPLAVSGFTVFFALMLLPEFAPWVRFAALGVSLAAGVLLLLFPRKRTLNRISARRTDNQRQVFAAASIAVAAACLLSWAGQSSLDIPAERYMDKTATVTAQVQEISAPRYGRYYAVCKAQTIDGQDASFRFRLSLRSPIPGAEGDTLTAKLTFFAYQNPAKRVCLGAYSSIDGEILTEAGKAGIGTWVYSLRGKLLTGVDEYLPNEYGAMARGLMLGEISGLSVQTNTAFRTLGLSHLIAVSGQHLSIWCTAVLTPLFVLLRTKKRAQALLISAFALLFMALTGFTDSIVRSGLMLILTQAGMIFNRRADALNSLGFAVLLICSLSPGAAQGLGLQLSFLATLGILLGTRRANSKQREEPKNRSSALRIITKGLPFLRGSAMCALFATLFTLPISLRVSGQLGLLAVPANIIFALPAGIALIGSGLCGLFSLIPGLNLLSAPPAFICGLCCKFMINAATALARVPFAALSARGPGMTIWLCGTLLICGLAVFLLSGYRRRCVQRLNRARRILSMAALLSAALLVSAQAADWNALRSGTRFTLAETGAVCVVLTRGSRTLLLGADGGGFNAAGGILDVLERNGSRSVDVILSGAGKTETENIAAVLAEIPARQIYSPDVGTGFLLPPGNSATVIASGQAIAWVQGVSILYCHSGEISAALVVTEGVRVLVLFSLPQKWSLLPADFLRADVLICPGAPRDIPPGLQLAITSNGAEHAARLAQLGVRAVSGGGLTAERGTLKLT
ncbi:MAG: ComEC/Rec2 family competence protein [Oscillospiraceae bacterium]|jgi:competence protein ComEC|nr:ComEC/Rec2 family competence protein [Oscillospiraceae bacterium]